MRRRGHLYSDAVLSLTEGFEAYGNLLAYLNPSNAESVDAGAFQIDDLTGNNNHGTASVNKPGYTADAGVDWNNESTLDFNESEMQMPNNISNPGSFAFVAVCRISSSNPSGSRVVEAVTDGADRFIIYTASTALNFRGASSTTGNIPVAHPKTIVVLMNHKSSTAIDCYVNDTKVTINPGAVPSANPTIWIGASPDFTQFDLIGSYGRTMFYDGALSDANAVNVINSLKSIYGIA